MLDKQEYTDFTKLLDEKGNLAVCGWARHNFFEYERRLAKPRSRVKEWDFYTISDGKFVLVFEFFNITLAAFAGLILIDLENKKIVNCGNTKLFARHSCLLPRLSDVPNFFRYDRAGVVCQFDTRRNCKKLEYTGRLKGKKIAVNVNIDIDKDYEGLTTVTPLDKPNQFFLANKQFAMRAEGKIIVDGKVLHEFKKDDSFATMDWGRGLWPYKGQWYWANGAQEIEFPDGTNHDFGFDFTWAINENANDLEAGLVVDGKIHKLGACSVEKFPGDNNSWMKEWHLKTEDGRFDATMTPIFDNCNNGIVLGIAGQNVHQVFGIWNGYGILDDGTKVEFKNMTAFCEYVISKW